MKKKHLLKLLRREQSLTRQALNLLSASYETDGDEGSPGSPMPEPEHKMIEPARTLADEMMRHYR